MINLRYVSRDTLNVVEGVMANPSVHEAAKTIIRRGLERDCVDAYADAYLAAGILKLVKNDILGGCHDHDV